MMHEDRKKVIILLATYNGEKYLREQLDSIINNQYENLMILISDDISTDSTPFILEEYSKKYSFIKIIKNEKQKHGAFYNFQNLVCFVKDNHLLAEYYMFSDQDDIWKNNKIRDSVIEIEKYNSEKPILIYTSKEYVNENLETIDFNISKEEIFDINILHQNKTFGCTYIFNKELLDKLDYQALDYFINYDHYVAFQAFLNGNVYYFPKKTILYRQHGNNVSGIVEKSFKDKINFMTKYSKNILLYKNLIKYANVNKKFLNKNNRYIVEKLSSAQNSRFSLFVISLFLHIRKNTLLATLQFYITILFNRI